MTAIRISIATLLLVVISGVQTWGQDCSSWRVRKLEQPPDWYVTALTQNAPDRSLLVNDSVRRTDYVLSSGETLVYFRCDRRQEDSIGLIGYPSALYLYGKDTVRLDTSYGGYWDLSFSADSTKCAAYAVESYYSDGDMGRVVVFYLRSRSKEFASFAVGGTEIEFSSWGWLAYNDRADLWIYDGTFLQLVLNKGGSYARDGGCMWQHLADIRWSVDGRTCVFKYYPGYETETQYELYAAHLPGPEEQRDSTAQK